MRESYDIWRPGKFDPDRVIKWGAVQTQAGGSGAVWDPGTNYVTLMPVTDMTGGTYTGAPAVQVALLADFVNNQTALNFHAQHGDVVGYIEQYTGEAVTINGQLTQLVGIVITPPPLPFCLAEITGHGAVTGIYTGTFHSAGGAPFNVAAQGTAPSSGNCQIVNVEELGGPLGSSSGWALPAGQYVIGFQVGWSFGTPSVPIVFVNNGNVGDESGYSLATGDYWNVGGAGVNAGAIPGEGISVPVSTPNGFRNVGIDSRGRVVAVSSASGATAFNGSGTYTNFTFVNGLCVAAS